eukprot:TRINITY_DN9793_c0_g1_i7.p1 TRINITY_DN9793_c0_g1~~TRINITY_DN9793_c0_g1_i7.p1  ORF type:complete len:117 (+),score=16.33 TRINITY_DN9793_c0_g1_i7:543-893(+)
MASTCALGKFTVPGRLVAMQDTPTSHPFPSRVRSFLSCFPDRRQTSQLQVRESLFAGDSFDSNHARFLNLVQSSPRLKPVAAQKLETITKELANTDADPITRLKQGFSNFKQQKYL